MFGKVAEFGNVSAFLAEDGDRYTARRTDPPPASAGCHRACGRSSGNPNSFCTEGITVGNLGSARACEYFIFVHC